MVARGRAARPGVDARIDHGAGRKRPARDHSDMHDRVRAALRVRDLEANPVGHEKAAITHLPPRLGVERRLAEHHRAFLLGLEPLDLSPVAQEGDDRRLAVEAVVAREGGRGTGTNDFRLRAGDGRHHRVRDDLGPPTEDRCLLEPARGAGAGALSFHRTLERVQIDTERALARDVRGQVHGKAIGVVELERRLAGDHVAVECVDRILEETHPLVEGPGELLFLPAQDALDALAALAQLGTGVAHLGVERRHHAPEERIAHPQPMAVADRATDDPPQHEAAALVRRHHAVGDEKRARPDVIGDDPQRLVGGVRGAGDLRRGIDQGDEEVGLVVAVHSLEHGGGALEPQSGVDRRLGQRLHVAPGVAVELHEHQVPQLDVAIAVLVGASRRAARHLGPVVVEHLGAGTAGPCVAHRPEVVLLAAAGEPGSIDADVVEPDPRRLVVLLVHRHPQLLRRESEHAGEELPAVADRLVLEVVAEAEVAEHLEEGVVARGVADVLEIVVLAAGPARSAARWPRAHRTAGRCRGTHP